ncbi:hypothetical protein MASR2M15_20970 [Anaerolineales bacterium]
MRWVSLWMILFLSLATSACQNQEAQLSVLYPRSTDIIYSESIFIEGQAIGIQHLSAQILLDDLSESQTQINVNPEGFWRLEIPMSHTAEKASIIFKYDEAEAIEYALDIQNFNQRPPGVYGTIQHLEIIQNAEGSTLYAYGRVSGTSSGRVFLRNGTFNELVDFYNPQPLNEVDWEIRHSFSSEASSDPYELVFMDPSTEAMIILAKVNYP